MVATTVSVVIPSFNRAHLLPRALGSVFAQTRRVDEIIVVDDGSTDGTCGVLTKFGTGLRVHRQPNRGVAAARNAGIKLARGQHIAFLDSDDEWLPAKIERQLAALAASGDMLVHCDEIWIRRGKRVNQMKKHRKRGGQLFQDCLPLCVISPSAVVINRHVFEYLGLFDESLPVCEDYDLWLRICSRQQVTFVPEPLVRKHGGHCDQLSSRYPAMDRFRIQALRKILREGFLGCDDRTAALETLAQRLRIYGYGAQKRGREADADRYLSWSDFYQRQLASNRAVQS